ncbi:MAG: TMEM175 family protein [Amnibacterium sp.]
MAEERGAERLIVFVDAVVAIAITLLVLPLAEVPRDEHGNTLHPLSGQLALDVSPLIGFAVSFFVIARFWWAHHQTFATVRRWSWPLVQLTVLWLFTIVLLPAVTAIAFEYAPERNPLAVAIYIGTMLTSSVLLTALSVVVHLDRAVAPTGGGAVSRNRVIGGAAASVAFAVALLLGTLVPAINYWALWLIAITGPFELLVRRAFARRDPRRLSEADGRIVASGREGPAPAASSPASRE